MSHPLAVLVTRVPWNQIEAAVSAPVAHKRQHKDRSGRVVADADLFGPTARLTGAGLNHAGRHRLRLRLPCDATQIGRFRRVLGEAGVEQLLKSSTEASVSMGAVKKTEFEMITRDTTVQEKAIAHPVDSRLQENSAAPSRRCLV